MEPEQMNPGEKIPVPAAFLAGQEKEAKRRENINEWRQYLSGQQRKALDEEGAYKGFRTRIPLEALKAFTPEERSNLGGHEQAEYRRLQPLAQAKDERRGGLSRPAALGRTSTPPGRAPAGTGTSSRWPRRTSSGPSARLRPTRKGTRICHQRR